LIPFLLNFLRLSVNCDRGVPILRKLALPLVEGNNFSTSVIDTFNRGVLLLVVYLFLLCCFPKILVTDDVVAVKHAPGLMA